MPLKTFFAYDPADDDETRLEKFSVFLLAGSCCVAGVFWAAMYFFVFNWGLTTALPLFFVLIVGGALIASHLTKKHMIAVYAEILCILYITTFIQWSIGGVFDSGFVIVWALLGPICALMFTSTRQSIFWFALFALNLFITVGFNDFFAGHGQVVAEGTRLFFFVLNLGVASLVLFLFALYYVSSARVERDRANRLLLNVLPKEIAPVLKASKESIAAYYDSASVLFADIVGSTSLFEDFDPEEAVDWLNAVFSMFDEMVEHYGVEKIRTIGDNYMVAAGVPAPRPDHAKALANLALDMLAGLEKLQPSLGKQLNFRIGINTGPLVAGVIGQSKFHYDVYGDSVNTASRMESHGEAGRIQITRATYEIVRDEFHCEPRGVIDVKGKGLVETWFLIGRR